MSRSGHRTGILTRVRWNVAGQLRRKEGRISQTFEHGITDIIMGADVTPRISNGIKEPIRGSETGRDAEEIRGGGRERADRILVVHEELENGQDQSTKNGFSGTHFKQGRQVVALGIAVHIRLSEPEVAHQAEAYPKRRVENSELGRQPRNRVLFIRLRPRRRENVDVRVRHDPQPTLRYSGHHTKASRSGAGTISILQGTMTRRIKPEERQRGADREKKEATYNTAADSASLVRGDQEDWKTSSLTRLRTTSQMPEKDQRWVDGVLSSWEEDMGDDGRRRGGDIGGRGGSVE